MDILIKPGRIYGQVIPGIDKMHTDCRQEQSWVEKAKFKKVNANCRTKAKSRLAIPSPRDKKDTPEFWYVPPKRITDTTRRLVKR